MEAIAYGSIQLKSDKIVHEEIVAPEMGIPIEIYTKMNRQHV